MKTPKMCCVTGKRFQTGHHVSKANNKVNRRFYANIQKQVLFSEVLGNVKLSITPNGLRTINYSGGLDNYLTSNPTMYGLEAKRLLKRFFLVKNRELEKSLKTNG